VEWTRSAVPLIQSLKVRLGWRRADLEEGTAEAPNIFGNR